jgi:hypothetical protein
MLWVEMIRFDYIENIELDIHLCTGLVVKLYI